MFSDRYFIELYQGTKAVGIYSLGYRVGMVVSLAVTAFNFAWSPAIFKIVEEKGAKKIFSDVLNHYVALISSLAAGINIGLNILLIPRMGMKGAAWATLFSYLSMTVWGFLLSQGLYRLRYNSKRLLVNLLLLTGVSLFSSPLPQLIYRILLFSPYLLWVLRTEGPLLREGYPSART